MNVFAVAWIISANRLLCLIPIFCIALHMNLLWFIKMGSCSGSDLHALTICLKVIHKAAGCTLWVTAGHLHSCDYIALLAELGVISHLKSNLSPYLHLNLLLNCTPNIMSTIYTFIWCSWTHKSKGLPFTPWDVHVLFADIRYYWFPFHFDAAILPFVYLWFTVCLEWLSHCLYRSSVKVTVSLLCKAAICHCHFTKWFA